MQNSDKHMISSAIKCILICLKPFFLRRNYKIYIDIKDTQGIAKVDRLREYLCNNVYDYDKQMVKRIQQVRSHEVELIELADFLTGAVCYHNRGLNGNTAKLQIIERLKQKSGYSLVRSTLYKEDKVNIFIWKGVRS